MHVYRDFLLFILLCFVGTVGAFGQAADNNFPFGLFLDEGLEDLRRLSAAFVGVTFMVRI